jgi:hypothetical protein
MLIHSLKYSLKVWLVTGIIPPFFFLVASLFIPTTTGHVEITTEEFFELSLVLGLAFSLPSALVLWLLINLLSHYNFSLRQIKTILITFAIAAGYFSFALLFQEPGFLKDSGTILLWAPYITTVAFTIVFFSLKPASSFSGNNKE